MWPQSTRLATALATGGIVVGKLDILVDGQLALSLDSTDPNFTDLGGPVAGRVDIQRGTVRRSCSVSLLDVDRLLNQQDALSLLVPLRAEVRLWRGCVFSDVTHEVPPADRELVPLGTFVVSDVDLSAWPLIEITGYDRAWLLAQHRNTTAYATVSGTSSMTALQDVLEFSTFPSSRLVTDFPSTDHTVGAQVWDAQTDLSEVVQDIASAAGLVFYSDPMGTFTCTPESDIDNDPVVLSYVEGTSLLILPTRKRSGGDARNAVVVTSSAPDLTTPVSGYAQDDDPTSATYVGALGVIPEFFDSPLVRTAAQADLAARTRLRNIVGLSDSTGITGLVQPGLESGDVVYLRSTTRGVDTKLIVDSFSVPLRVGEVQTLTCRAKVTTT
jgi:hypothetical protein